MSTTDDGPGTPPAPSPRERGFRLGFRSRLFLVSVLLVLSVGLVSGIFLESQLHRLLVQRGRDALRDEARLAAELVELALSADDLAAADSLAELVSGATGARVTIIDGSGRVLGDSEVDGTELVGLENHRQRPEVSQVLDGGAEVGIATRISATLGQELTYLAVPYERPPDVRGVVRLSLPTSATQAEINRLRQLMGGAGVLGLLVAAFMSMLAAQLAARELRQVVNQTRGLIQDDLQGEVDEESDGFLGLTGSVAALGEALQKNMRSLAKERDRFDGVLSSMTGGVLALSRKGRIKVWNPAAVALLQLPLEGLRNRYLIDLVRVPPLIELIEQAHQGRSGTVEFEYRGRGPKDPTAAKRSPRVLQAIATPLRETPGRSGRGCVLVLQDVSELRRLETVRRDFIANVSHELRTPVSVVKAAAEALQDGAIEDPEHAAIFLDSIVRNAERQAALVQDLLSLSRIEAGRMELDPEPIDLLDAVGHVVSSVGVKAEERGQTISVAVPSGLLAFVDARALDQVLTNLTANAVKYIDEGGHIEVFAQALPTARVRLEVRDDGPGVPPQHRGRLFERFYRVDKGRSRNMGGTGLGLAIVKHLVEVMDGQVGMVPNEPRGSVFWVELPGPASDGRVGEVGATPEAAASARAEEPDPIDSSPDANPIVT